MPKSHKRGGEKAHRKRLKNRNKLIDQQKKHYTKLFNDRLRESLEKKENENTNNEGIRGPIEFQQKD
jgi:hypothetical protein